MKENKVQPEVIEGVSVEDCIIASNIVLNVSFTLDLVSEHKNNSLFDGCKLDDRKKEPKPEIVLIVTDDKACIKQADNVAVVQLVSATSATEGSASDIAVSKAMFAVQLVEHEVYPAGEHQEVTGEMLSKAQEFFSVFKTQGHKKGTMVELVVNKGGKKTSLGFIREFKLYDNCLDDAKASAQ